MLPLFALEILGRRGAGLIAVGSSELSLCSGAAIYVLNVGAIRCLRYFDTGP